MQDGGSKITDTPSSTRWLILAACFLARTGIGLQFIAMAALMPVIRDELNLDYTQIGLLLGLFMVMGVFLSLPSGMIAARWGDRRTLFIGLAALIAAGLIVALAESFATMLAGRVLGGVGAVFITVTAAKILTDWFHGREITTAMGVLGLAWPVGIALGLSMLPSFADWWNWRTAVQITIVLPVLAATVALLFPRLGRSLDRTTDGKGDALPLWSISKPELVTILIAASAWPLMSSGGFVVFSSYAANLIVSNNLTYAEAGLILGMMSWLFMVTIPLGGWMADRWGRGDAQFWLGCLASALAIGLVPFGGPIVAWVLLTAVMGITVGPIMALPGQILAPTSRATGLGVYYSIYYLGTVIFPAFAGWLLDVTGSAVWVIWFAAGCLVVAPVFVTWSRILQRRRGIGL